MKKTKPTRFSGSSLFGILRPYRSLIILLAVLSVAANALTLWLPKVLSHAIDAYASNLLVLTDVAWEFGGLSVVIFILTYLQSIVQVYASEKVAKDMRVALAGKISQQSQMFVQKVGPAKLLTNLTSDMDAVKTFVAQAIASLISSTFLIIGAGILLLLTNWRLGLAVLVIVPVIGVTFFLTLRKVRKLFFQSRAIIDRLNQVINESILGAALIRVLNSQAVEDKKFQRANSDSQDLGIRIVNIFSGLIPVITFLASSATIIILALGGHLIISGSMSLGDYAAFSSYLSILIFPILILGFMSNVIAQASASYERIAEALNAPVKKETGKLTTQLRGNIELKNVTVKFGEKIAVNNVSFSVKAGTRMAIIGPTAAGKTQLLYVLTGLMEPDSGTVLFDGQNIQDYDKVAFHRQVGFVFQDSIIFNMSLRENIAFSQAVSEADMQKAIAAAELHDLIAAFPQGLETVISERGTNLSGGQKQRLMLARALALNPKILLLDDFTARVDTATEAKILNNLAQNYPHLTLLSITQKVEAIKDYDQIVLLMEGECLANGTHQQLLKSSPEYVQIFHSQQSTNAL